MAVKYYWQTVAIQYTLIPKYSNHRLLNRKVGYAPQWSQTHWRSGRETLPHKLMNLHSRSRTGMRRSTRSKTRSFLTDSLGQYWLQDDLLVSSSGFNMEIQGVPKVFFSTATPCDLLLAFQCASQYWASNSVPLNTVGIKFKVSCMLGTGSSPELHPPAPRMFLFNLHGHSSLFSSTKGKRDTLKFAILGNWDKESEKFAFPLLLIFVFKIQNQNSLD